MSDKELGLWVVRSNFLAKNDLHRQLELRVGCRRWCMQLWPSDKVGEEGKGGWSRAILERERESVEIEEREDRLKK